VHSAGGEGAFAAQSVQSSTLAEMTDTEEEHILTCRGAASPLWQSGSTSLYGIKLLRSRYCKPMALRSGSCVSAAGSPQDDDKEYFHSFDEKLCDSLDYFDNAQ
jgi:hypothetical protein